MPEVKRDGYYIGAMDEDVVDLVVNLAHKKRKNAKVTIDYKAKNFKNHIKSADKANAKYFCIIGSNEVENQTLTIKDLENKTERTLLISEF